MTQVQKQPATRQTMRLDKWLWAARFFKTRSLAQEAIQGGKVHLNGQRTKSGKEIHIGALLDISIGGLDWAIEVLVLPNQRRPAAEASLFYLESEDSKTRRKTRIEAQRHEREAHPSPSPGRPSKRDRRLIHRFTSAP